MQPQTVVMLVTPKIFRDFEQPDSSASEFFERYRPLTEHAEKVIVILAIGGGDHILRYRGRQYWSDEVDWARTTDGAPVSSKTMDYNLIEKLRQALDDAATRKGIRLEVFDLMDSGGEFTTGQGFKYGLHSECTINNWGMFDVRARLLSDVAIYASRPDGIPEGELCGNFLVDQTGAYLSDFGFDGILFGNQLGTRGRWSKGDGPGYTDVEAKGILDFLRYTREVLKTRQVMWSDSYNTVEVEHDTWSFPAEGYQYFDYIVASGFCVIPWKEDDQYVKDLKSKLALKQSKILASLDYVDPWYSYRSITQYAECSQRLEGDAVKYRNRINGLWFLANDSNGDFIPADVVQRFAKLYFN
jgi:hypothetical protein